VATAFGSEEPPVLADEPALHFPAPKLQVGLEPPKETQEDTQSLHFPAEGAKYLNSKPKYLLFARLV
jgi:hypothetical protein